MMIDISKLENPFDIEEAKKLGVNTDNKMSYFTQLGLFLFAKYHYPDLNRDDAQIKSQLIFLDMTREQSEKHQVKDTHRSSCCGGGEVR